MINLASVSGVFVSSWSVFLTTSVWSKQPVLKKLSETKSVYGSAYPGIKCKIQRIFQQWGFLWYFCNSIKTNNIVFVIGMPCVISQGSRERLYDMFTIFLSHGKGGSFQLSSTMFLSLALPESSNLQYIFICILRCVIVYKMSKYYR